MFQGNAPPIGSKVNSFVSPASVIYGVLIGGADAPTEIALDEVPGEPTVHIFGPLMCILIINFKRNPE